MKYGTVFYEACKANNIAPIQWLYLDMIRGLATANETHGYYANASNAYYSDALCVSVKTIQNYSKQLSTAGWLEIKDNGHRKTTQAFNQLYLSCRQGEKIAPMKILHGGGEKIAPIGVKKLHGRGEKIAPNNNSIITEDNNKDKGLPFSSSSFKEAWAMWEQHRKEKRIPLTATSIKMQLKKLSEIGEERAIAMLNFTIEKGWTGLREEEKKAQPQQQVHAPPKQTNERYKPLNNQSSNEPYKI